MIHRGLRFTITVVLLAILAGTLSGCACDMWCQYYASATIAADRGIDAVLEAHMTPADRQRAALKRADAKDVELDCTSTREQPPDTYGCTPLNTWQPLQARAERRSVIIHTRFQHWLGKINDDDAEAITGWAQAGIDRWDQRVLWCLRNDPTGANAYFDDCRAVLYQHRLHP